MYVLAIIIIMARDFFITIYIILFFNPLVRSIQNNEDNIILKIVFPI